MRTVTTRIGFALGAVGFAATLAVACSGGNPPGLGDNAGRDGSIVGATCDGTPEEGCPCSVGGDVEACGKVIDMSGGYVTCSIGHAMCDGTTWGECVGNTITTKSLPGATLASGGIHIDSMPTTCTNLCDPNNSSATLSGPGDVGDAAGLAVGEGGS